MSLYRHLNWGFIGCGHVTEVKSGPVFNAIPHSRIVAVMRRDRGKAMDYAARHQIPKYYSDADLLLEDDEINAVYIATPPDSHAFYAIKAMKAGKVVYVEKPMARTYKECMDMKNCSRNTGIPLFVAYYRRALPYYQKIKEILDENILGDISRIELKLFRSANKHDLQRSNLPWRVIPEISGGGYFIDLASHQLDILDYYLGAGQIIKSSATNEAKLYQAEDTVKASLAYPKGIQLEGAWSFVSSGSDEKDRVKIMGSAGELSFSFFSSEPIILATEENEEMYDLKPPLHIQKPMITSIVDELLGKGKAPSDLESAIRTSRLMEEIIKPFYTLDNA